MNPLPVGNLGGGAAAGGHVRDLRLAYGQSFRFDRETRGVPVAFFVGLAPPKRHEQPPGELCCDPRIEAAHSGRGHHDHLVQVGAEEGGLLAFDEVAGRAVREREVGVVTIHLGCDHQDRRHRGAEPRGQFMYESAGAAPAEHGDVVGRGDRSQVASA